MTKNRLHYGKKEFIKKVMSSYSDDFYHKIPFTCMSPLSNEEVRNRLAGIIYKKHPPNHWGGCGYSCNISEFHRETPTSGHIIIMEYCGIGD